MVDGIIAAFFLLTFVIALSGGDVNVESHHAFELARFNNGARTLCFVVLVLAILVLTFNRGDLR